MLTEYVPYNNAGKHQHLYYKTVITLNDFFKERLPFERERAVKAWQRDAKGHFDYPGGWLEYEESSPFGIMRVLELRCCPFKKVPTRFQQENKVLVVV